MSKYYPIADGELVHVRIGDPLAGRVVLTGEKRTPLRGEWYLSGAIPEGYMAPNDLSTEYHICKLVYGEFQKVWVPVNA